MVVIVGHGLEVLIIAAVFVVIVAIILDIVIVAVAVEIGGGEQKKRRRGIHYFQKAKPDFFRSLQNHIHHIT